MVLVAAASVATAQRDGDSLHWQGFETNRFWDNWEISADAAIVLFNDVETYFVW